MTRQETGPGGCWLIVKTESNLIIWDKPPIMCNGKDTAGERSRQGSSSYIASSRISMWESCSMPQSSHLWKMTKVSWLLLRGSLRISTKGYSERILCDGDVLCEHCLERQNEDFIHKNARFMKLKYIYRISNWFYVYLIY